jgi:hypothetical protein
VNNKKPDPDQKPGSGSDVDDKPASFAEATAAATTSATAALTRRLGQ